MKVESGEFLKKLFQTSFALEYCATTCGLCAGEDMPELNLQKNQLKTYGVVRKDGEVQNPVLEV